MAEMLTPQQKKAVYDRGGKLLVSAAAGSGKTKVLVDRLMSYITDPVAPANLDDFLIITYTKAAAAELRGKIAAKISEKIAEEPANRHLQQQMQRLYLTKISTVHAFCADLLREYAYLLDIPGDFRVADENECTELQLQALEPLLEQVYRDLAEDPELRAFIDSQGFGRDDRQVPLIILKVFQSARCHLDPEKWLAWCADAVDTTDLTDAAETVWGKYLLEDLQKELCLQINALKNCAVAAAASDGMEKPAALLEATVSQLQFLADADTWDTVIARKDIDFGRLNFSSKCTDLELTERIKAVRNACKKDLERKLKSFAADSAQVLSDLNSASSAAKGLVKLVGLFSTEYDKRKKMRRVLDFGDLEHRTLDLLVGKRRSGPTALAAQIGARYREILVDEYQDSNGVQDAIFNALTAQRQNCFLVGDVKQSIYQFRLADPSIFIDKYNAYAMADTAAPMEGRKVLLSNNFRSSGGILEAVNDVFGNCMSPQVGGIDYTEDEMLYEGVPHVPLEEPEVTLYGIDIREDTYAEEAAFTAEKICQLLDGTHMIRSADKLRPIQPEDIVILLRSPSSVGGEFVYALEARGIRCTTGGSVDLLQTEEIITLRSLLQIICNPLQDIPLIAVMASRVFGFTANDLSAIRSQYRRCTFYEILCKQKDQKSQYFLSVLQTLRKEARLYTLPQLLQRIFLHTSLDSLYGALPDGPERVQNLQMFCQLATDFESSGRKDLGQFLDHLDAMEEKGLVSLGEQKNTGMVTIMSIHKSKGLEFPVVFLCGLSRGFNQENAREPVLCHKDLGLGLSCVDTKNRVRYPTVAKRAIAVKMQAESISEEMRVLYVAMTRPRDRLIMTYAAKNLDKDLADISLRLDMSGQHLMTSHVDCPGTWVLLTAMQRTEAGALFYIGGRPDHVSLKEPIWKIDVTHAPDTTPVSASETRSMGHISEGMLASLKTSLTFTYPHLAATGAASKQTATQMKGRYKDQEVAEHTEEVQHIVRDFRKPAFAGRQNDGREKGNAMHAVMQQIDYSACADVAGIEGELERLVLQKYISEDQRKLVDSGKIAALFATELGEKMRTGVEVLREFKFSVLMDWGQYDRELTGEQVLLQGVVDCALIEPQGITVIDFKTDQVTPETVPKLVDRYAPQVAVYADALERIYQKKVTGKYLYLFGIDRFVEIRD